MKAIVQNTRKRWKLAAFVGCALLISFTPNHAWAEDADYGFQVFGGSSYVQRGPGPAYSGAYSDYGGNATGIEGRFSASYGESGAVPGYGRFGAGSSFGSGPLRAAGTGRGSQDFGRGNKQATQGKAASQAPAHQKPESDLPF